ncbi:hypothetical protein GCM10009092_17740 [Bowmanella denitrificans]|uniref:General secretion pathway protein M n=1 Tax=Bowmanella denitrificans TaxID=366582 RepID=A0ABN0X3P4_9ALTE
MSKLKKQILIGFLLVLAVLKFVIVPVLEWQDEKVAQINTLGQQLSKGTKLLAVQKELELKLQALQAQKGDVLPMLTTDEPSATQFQLQVQRKIDELMAKHELNVQNVNWLTPRPKGMAVEHRLEIRMTGGLKEYLALMIDIEQQKPKLAIVEVNSLISNMRPAGYTLGRVNGRLVISAWQQGEAR